MRIIILALIVGYAAWVTVGYGWWAGFASLLMAGVVLWAVLTLLDLFRAVRNALRRPNVNVFVEQAHVHRHSDPTRPDDAIELEPKDYREVS